MADICALSTVDFAHWIGLDLEPEHAHLAAWHERLTARPSAAA
jgi:glutathione S-transferase